MSRSSGLSALREATRRNAERSEFDDDYDARDPEVGTPPTPLSKAVRPEPAKPARATAAREVTRADANGSQSVATVVQPALKRPGGDRVHTSIYLPRDVWRRLRAIAATEDCKVHDLIMEGVGKVVARRG